jgi:tetratricopeptide (TPR) repeat protein
VHTGRLGARWAALIGLAALAGDARSQQTTAAPEKASPPGAWLSAPPSVLPGSVPPLPENPLLLAAERYQEGDLRGVVSLIEPWLELGRAGPTGRTRSAAHLLLGVAWMGLDEWNLASANFTRVRTSGGPLASYGAWYEAEVDLLRGRGAVAARECAGYRKAWPDGPKADECLLLMGDAWAAEGNRGASVSAYRSYLDLHPETPRKEEIDLNIALAVAQTTPQQGIPLLQGLVLNHSWHSTAMSAQKALDDMAARGMDTAIPETRENRIRRAEAARRCGQHDEAWELFSRLTADAPSDPDLQRWVDSNEDRFAWATRNYDVYATSLEATFAKDPKPELAWRIFTAWSRAGRWDNAARWGQESLERWPTAGSWRSAQDDIAYAELVAGQYDKAELRFGTLAAKGGDYGRKALFYQGFAAYRAGHHQAALDVLSRATEKGREWAPAALYWRARTLEALGRNDEANPLFEAAAEADPTGWYRLLIERASAAALKAEPGDGWQRHDGRWYGGALATLTPPPALDVRAVPLAQPWAATSPILTDVARSEPALLVPADRSVDWSALRWVAGASPPQDATSKVHVAQGSPTPAAGVGDALAALTPTARMAPQSYAACAFFDPAESWKSFESFARVHAALWPDLDAAYDLARAGLYTEAARLLEIAHGEWKAAQGLAAPTPRQQQLQGLRITVPEWRQLFLVTRNHPNAARYCYGLDKLATDDSGRDDAMRLAYPLVRPAELWDTGRRYNVDPLLMLGLMRQESTYQNSALSPVGAIGLVQVMPRTGAKIAALLGDARYSPRALEDPAVNLRFGTFYMSLLMKRFDGVFPLAVASYNGGPHNVSRWYRPWVERGIELDAFVEQIQYDETRDYVKKVSGYYDRYVDLYGTPGASVAVPMRPAGDDRTVVDF